MLMALPTQKIRHLPDPIKGRFQVLFVHQTHPHQVERTFLDWRVIVAAPVQAQQRTLAA